MPTQTATLQDITMDGTLELAEALGALRKASQAATSALPSALAKCETIEQRQEVMADRDTCVRIYLKCLKQSLELTLLMSL